MTLRFLHTADFQIGKPYNWADDRAQKTLRERREQAIERVGEVASERDADFIVVAGDFFDVNIIEDDVITRACRRLSSVGVPAAAVRGLTGRQPMSVWTGKLLRMKRSFQVSTAFLLAEQLVKWKTNHPIVSDAISWNMLGKLVPSRTERVFSLELT